MKKIRYILETIISWLLYGLFRLLPIKLASCLGGYIASTIGPKIKISQIAHKNLSNAMPALSDNEINHIVNNMWRNLGQIIGEFPHIPNIIQKLPAENLTITGKHHLYKAQKDGKGGIIFSGHIGNWEMLPRAVSSLGIPVTLVYRPANNKGVNMLMRISRRNSHKGMYAKGLPAARHATKALKNGEFVGMLVDQKMNEGISVPFFGQNAMTAPALAELALKYNTPIIPARVIRKENTSFEVEIFPPMDIEGKTPAEIMTEVNSIMEGWIRQYPEQWFWLHKRWGNV